MKRTVEMSTAAEFEKDLKALLEKHCTMLLVEVGAGRDPRGGSMPVGTIRALINSVDSNGQVQIEKFNLGSFVSHI
jgi:hypothetical protein